MSSKYQKNNPGRPRGLLGPLVILLGAALLTAAIVLVIRGRTLESQAEKNVQEALAALESGTAPADTTETTPAETETEEATEPTLATDPTDPPTLITEMIDGHEYVGYLEFPSLERKLPIIKIKYMDDLQVAPCLERGSPHEDNAVICAHNYPSHFGPIRDWTGGEEVIFTDLEGNVIRYSVQIVQTISPDQVEEVMESEYDLVLYTCTPGGAKRVMLGCDRSE